MKVPVPGSDIVNDIEGFKANEIGCPLIVRPAFTEVVTMRKRTKRSCSKWLEIQPGNTMFIRKIHRRLQRN